MFMCSTATRMFVVGEGRGEEEQQGKMGILNKFLCQLQCKVGKFRVARYLFVTIGRY